MSEDKPVTEGVTEKDIEKAAQLWCLPKHSNKEMDVEFATSIAKALAAERREVRKNALEIKELGDLHEFLAHDLTCILTSWEAGEPTENGGYRSKYAGKWYESRPVDKTPKCNCGLDKAFEDFQSLKDKYK